MSATKRKAATVEAGDIRDMQVRAREASHLNQLRELMAEHGAVLGETLKSEGADYQYRAFCTQDDLAVGVAALAYSIDYVNFKDSVADDKLHSVYNRIWSAVLNAFPVGSIYGTPWRQPRQRKGKGKGGGRRAAGLPVDNIDHNALVRPWWMDVPGVDEEMATHDHDRPFEWGDALPVRPSQR